MYLNPVPSKLKVGGFTLFSFDYFPSALTEFHGKNLTDFSENNLYKSPERGVLSSPGCGGGCRDGCSSARSRDCWLCTQLATGQSREAPEQGWLCPTGPDLSSFICTYPGGCDLSKSKKTLKINLSNSWILPLRSQPTRQFPYTSAAEKAFPFLQLLEEISVAAVFLYIPILTSSHWISCEIRAVPGNITLG